MSKLIRNSLMAGTPRPSRAGWRWTTPLQQVVPAQTASG